MAEVRPLVRVGGLSLGSLCILDALLTWTSINTWGSSASTLSFPSHLLYSVLTRPHTKELCRGLHPQPCVAETPQEIR